MGLLDVFSPRGDSATSPLMAAVLGLLAWNGVKPGAAGQREGDRSPGSLEGMLRNSPLGSLFGGTSAKPTDGTTRGFVGARDRNLTLDQCAHPRLLRSLTAPLAVVERFRLDPESLDFLRKQLANRQRLRGQAPGPVGIGGLVMLRLARYLRIGDDLAVYADRLWPGEAATGGAWRGGRLGGAHGLHSAGWREAGSGRRRRTT